MARNKYPEKTIELILDTSKELFLKNGYENTSIQDILENLKGLSKGAIYHHFKSKEAIFEAISMREAEKNKIAFLEIKNNANLNGADKLKEIIKFNITSEATRNIIKLCPNLLDNPKFLSMELKHMYDIFIPEFIVPIVEEGVKDGSIKTNKSYELAESIMLFINIWLNPLIFQDDVERLTNKFEMINEFFKPYQLELFDEDSKKDFMELQKERVVIK